ncbi:MAG: hypothetical protein ACF8OB_00050 [Phycisphaeraceae bacterium JB051]
MTRNLCLLILAVLLLGCSKEEPSTQNQISNPLTQTDKAPATPSGNQSFAHSKTLLTPHYRITISDNRQEGDVAYDGVQYHGVSRTTGKSITLMGSTYHLHDKQGTPTRFLGYRFVNGDTTYDILEIDDRPRLIVHQNNHTIIDEHGDWVKGH